MALTLHHDNLGRRVAHLLLALVLAGSVGCRREPPPIHPILKNNQARLDAVEQRLRSKPAPGPTYADYLELGIARYQVWSMLNRRKAKRLKRDVIDAFERAMGQSSDPLVAARAKLWLSRVYGDIPDPDRDKQIAMLKRILKEHADMDAPLFGLGRTPHYYCNYTLAGVYQQKGERANAIDALARALVAISALEKSGATKPSYRPALLLGRLLDYEPRAVLGSYQRLLPPGTRDILRAHRATAPTRIILTLERADHSEVAVRYKVIFPGYPATIKAWRQQKRPRVRLPDDFSHVKPAFRLSFRALAAGTDGFETHDAGPAGLAPRQFTPVLPFDENTTVTGKVLLKWSDNAGLRRDVYLTAKLVRAYPGGFGPALSAGQVYVQPIRVTVEAR